MDTNSYVMIGVAILAMFFGYFFGLFEGRGQGYKKRKKEEEEGLAVESAEGEPESPDEPQPSEPEELPEMPVPPMQSNLLCLSQDADGQMRLDLDDELSQVHHPRRET
ncbi:MAG: hypothetical protein ACK2TX_13700, partial [Anaerolineales bacterium]